jgi:FixJ family two-component response regulator
MLPRKAKLCDQPLISIVDDDRSFRDSLRRLLKSFGYVVKVFPSAADFFASTHIDKTSCLILDINMPEITGLELHRQLIQTGYRIPTILITAYPDAAVRLRALNDGVVGYLNKPCEESDLLDYLRLALDARKATP